jgi:Bacterial Ig-like domain
MVYNLIFFVFPFIFSCQGESEDVILHWENKRVTGISVRGNLIKGASDSANYYFVVQLKGQHLPIAGDYKRVGDRVLFEPVIPFTPGIHYEVLINHQAVKEILISEPELAQSPTVQAIFPTQDTLPENLLKIYVRFSQPMRESESLRNIFLVKNNGDTLPGTFLDLQPELWDREGMMLTLWLDPGRIKRDLQPNKALGSPLKKGEEYVLVIKKGWKDKWGASLQSDYHKKFVAIIRDSLSPDPGRWEIIPPRKETNLPVWINFKEPLDYSLLTETFRLVDPQGNKVPGVVKIMDEEKRINFIPEDAWRQGRYTFQIETRLEDIAGNNLNRPFDRDLWDKKIKPTNRVLAELAFVVKD